jgi:hypothetical protein
MLVRNRRTDEYKRAMDIVREWFEKEDPSLRAYRPFPPSLRHRLKVENLDEVMRCVCKTPGAVPTELHEALSATPKLKGEAQIREIEEGCRWLLCTKGPCPRWLPWPTSGRYLLKKTDGALAVYEPRKVHWGGLAEMVGVMNGLFFGALLALSALAWRILQGSCVGTARIAGAVALGLLGLVGAILAQSLLMIWFYEEYDLRIPQEDG